MRKIKNVIIVCDYAYVEGGATKVALQTVEALAKYTSLKVICFVGCGIPSNELLQSGADFVTLQMQDLLGNKSKIRAAIQGIYNFKSSKKLKELLLNYNREDTVVHIHTWTKVLSCSIFNVCKKLKFRTFLTVHDYFVSCPNGSYYNFKTNKICELKPMGLNCCICNCDSRSYFQKVWRLMRQIVQNRVINNFEKLNYVFISNFQKYQLERRYKKCRFSYLLKNPIYSKAISRIQVEKNEYYLFIGRVDQEKGVDLFCKSVTEAGVHGVVIGKGKMERALRQNYPNIDFLGWKNKEEIIEILKKARILLFTSVWYEGSPLTTAEVLSYGIPCIVTNCSSALEDITDNKNGFIVEKNVKSIVKAIENAKLDSVVQQLSISAFETFDRKRLSLDFYANSLLRLYNDIK